MTPTPPLLLIVIILTLLFFTNSGLGAQDRAPHGLAHESLMTLSPSAYDFFHPNTQLSGQNPCEDFNCSPLPLAATVQSSLAHESRAENDNGGSKVGAGGIAAIIFGFVFALLLAMGVYYVMTTRHTNLNRNSTIIPSA